MTAGRKLWDRALPLLRTPVKRTIDVGVITRGLPVVDAGLTALARRTMLAAPPIATVATEHRALRRALATREVLPWAAEDEPAKRVEAWAYDPRLLTDDLTADPLSLWLSLRHDPDERVQAALGELLEAVPW
jgi:hypothetical protein